MERLHQIVLGVAFLSILAVRPAAAQTHCSLVVRVQTPDGRRPVAPVSVYEKDGRKEEREHSGQDVSFCDLGILPVTVTVGSGGICNQVSIKDVPISLDDTYLLQVLYDPLACGETIRTAACTILFRVADSAGKWISGVEIQLFNPTQARLVTDSYGRAEFVAAFGTEVRGQISHPAEGVTSFRWACSRSEPRHEARIIINP